MVNLTIYDEKFHYRNKSECVYKIFILCMNHWVINSNILCNNEIECVMCTSVWVNNLLNVTNEFIIYSFWFSAGLIETKVVTTINCIV